MFSHRVHFWIHDHVDDAERAAFVAALQGLGRSPNVPAAHVGVPAGTPRDVVDNSWDYALRIEFPDRATHDRYQSADDAVHAAFVADWNHVWERIRVYDVVSV